MKITLSADERPQPLSKLGSLIANVRKSQGLTLRALWELIKQPTKSKQTPYSVSLGLLSGYESGRIADPNPELLGVLAEVLGMNYFEILITLVEEKYIPQKGWRQREIALFNLVKAVLEAPPIIQHLSELTATKLDLETARLNAFAQLGNSSGLLPFSTLIDWEQGLEAGTKIWILAPDFLAVENSEIRDGIVENILKKPAVSYDYLIDPSETNRFSVFLATLKKHPKLAGRSKLVDKNIRMIPLPSEIVRWIFSDVVIINPNDIENALGFSYLRQQSTLFAYPLDKRDLERILKNLKNLEGIS